MTHAPTVLGAIAALLAGTAAAQDSDLLVFDYSGFENPDYHQPYTETHGASPTFAFFGDEEEAFQKLNSGFRADVSHLCAGSVPKWTESGILEPWDTSRIESWANIDAALTGQEVGSSEEVFFLPTDFGSTAIAYNTEEVPEEDVASLAVFQNPAYAGRMAIPDNVDDAFALAYLATGVTDWTGASDAEFEAAAEWLRSVHENLRTYWVDPGELAQLMATGEVLVAWAWNETLPTLAEQGFPIGFQREPAEGSSLWLCGYGNLANGGGSEDKVYDYVNAFLSEASAEPLLTDGWGSANRAALEGVGEEALVASGLGTIEGPVLAQLPIPNEQREKQAEAFERIKAGF